MFTVAGSLCVLDLHANEINTKWNDLLSNQQQIEEDTVKAQRNWDVGFIVLNFDNFCTVTCHLNTHF